MVVRADLGRMAINGYSILPKNLLSDDLVSYPEYTYPSAEKQSEYSIIPANWGYIYIYIYIEECLFKQRVIIQASFIIDDGTLFIIFN